MTNQVEGVKTFGSRRRVPIGMRIIIRIAFDTSRPPILCPATAGFVGRPAEPVLISVVWCTQHDISCTGSKCVYFANNKRWTVYIHCKACVCVCIVVVSRKREKRGEKIPDSVPVALRLTGAEAEIIYVCERACTGG